MKQWPLASLTALPPLRLPRTRWLGSSSLPLHSHTQGDRRLTTRRWMQEIRKSAVYDELCSRMSPEQTQKEVYWLADSLLDGTDEHKKRDEKTSLQALLKSMQRRLDGEPLQYIIGNTCFCRLKVLCKRPILIPRPETEQLCYWLAYVMQTCRTGDEWPQHVPINLLEGGNSSLSVQEGHPHRVVLLDACSGSGNISLALASLLFRSSNICDVVGFDVSDEALELSRCNLEQVSRTHAEAFRCVSFVKHDVLAEDAQELLHKLENHSRFDVLISNPPYIRTNELASLKKEVSDWEDHKALHAGADGIQFYTRLIQCSSVWLKPIDASLNTGLPELLFEVGDNVQALQVKQLCLRAGFVRAQIFLDWFGKPRWIAASRFARLGCGSGC